MAPDDAQPAPDNEQPVTLDRDRLSETLSALARRHGIPGAQLAVHLGGETVAVEVGELEHETGRPVERDAAFPVGSVTKALTATVAMILAADDDLELDVPVGSYVAELGAGTGGAGGQITLRHLLSHTSGLADGPDSSDVAGLSLRRYVLDQCRRPELLFRPGTRFSYSNIGYVLTGHLIEVVTGMTWWEAVDAILLQPLGIQPAFVAGPDLSPAGRPIATGHSVNASLGRVRPVQQSLPLAEAPAGALALSAVDLLAFGLAHAGTHPSAILPPASARQMREPVSEAEPFGLADGWGLGLALFSSGSVLWVGHDGNADGTACYLRVDPTGGTVIAFTSNGNIGLLVWQELVATLAAEGFPISSYSTATALGTPVPPPPDCLGAYVNGSTEYVVTERGSGDLCLMVDGEVVARLTFHEGSAFLQHDWQSGQPLPAGRFLRDPVTGALDLIQINGRIGRRRAAPGRI